jgi:hypothetical protein
MLGTAAAIFLCLLPSQVDGLITASAKCLPGYDWVCSASSDSLISIPIIFASDVQFDQPKSLRRGSGACFSL